MKRKFDCTTPPDSSKDNHSKRHKAGGPPYHTPDSINSWVHQLPDDAPDDAPMASFVESDTISSVPRTDTTTPKAYSEALYRSYNLSAANVFIGTRVPADVLRRVEAILCSHGTDVPDVPAEIAAELYHDSLGMAQAGEANWTDPFIAVVRRLTRRYDADLVWHRDREWLPDLKPPRTPRTTTSQQLQSTVPQKRKRSAMPGMTLATDQAMLHQFRPKMPCRVTSSGSPMPTQELAMPPPPPRSSKSSQTSRSSKSKSQTSGSLHTAVSAGGLRTPKPDLYIGFSDDALTSPSVPRMFLTDIQQEGVLISDASPMMVGCRFPFLIIEAKSAATGGNPFQAENQAAVGGACAVRLLQKIQEVTLSSGSDQASTGPASNLNAAAPTAAPTAETVNVDNADDATTSATATSSMSNALVRFGNSTVDNRDPSPILFSLTTERSSVMLWVHHYVAPTYRYEMSKVGAWDCMIPTCAVDFVRRLAAVIEWSVHELKPWLVEKIKTYWEIQGSFTE